MSFLHSQMLTAMLGLLRSEVNSVLKLSMLTKQGMSGSRSNAIYSTQDLETLMRVETGVYSRQVPAASASDCP